MERIIKNRKCPLCGHEKKNLLFEMKNTMSEVVRERTGYPSFYSIVSCEECGMVYTDIEISDENIDNYYANENMYDNISTLKRHIYTKAEEMYYSFVNNYINEKSYIVDVGCGSGNFLKYLYSKKYCFVYGIDPSKESVDNLSLNGIKGQVGNVYTCDEINNTKNIDMIISTGVLEHLLFPRDALKHMANMLNNNGYMYICVPASEKYCEELLPKANYFNHEHINHFTKQSLGMLAESVGLSIVEMQITKACEELEYSLNAVLRKSEEYYDANIKGKDRIGRESIEKYFNKISLEESKTLAVLQNIINKKKKVIMWGTGNYAGSILKQCSEIRDNILFFVDNNPKREGTEYYGKKVYRPDILVKNIDNVEDSLLLICVMQSKKEIANDIRSLNIRNEVVFL